MGLTKLFHAKIACCKLLVHFIKISLSSRMKMRLPIQQMKVKNLPSHLETKTTTQKQDFPLKT